ncbi:MAG: hypothetical protein U9R25_01515 [Chloroflexota bacterium]|nr:hypothetical protein [Chloroflexota bacterium]
MTTYAENVSKRLDQVRASNSLQQVRELGDLRLILLSDLHKGVRDGADDFRRCEQVYLAALEHYWQQGYELWLIGDVEELWENLPQPVIDAYENVLHREQSFAEARQPDRYIRFVGNHDLNWYDSRQVMRYLGPFLGGKQVIEGLRVTVTDRGQELGELFLVHGHQGTLDSDHLSGLSLLVVRYIWRPIQRLLNIPSSTPSNNFQLKKRHELAMYSYAAGQPGTVLIAGHTHHPVWEGLSFQQAMEKTIRAEGLPSATGKQWIEEEIGGEIVLPGEKPCYFNTGCCSFGDSTITGIEIEGGEIRLVRWGDPNNPTRTALFGADLAQVLRAVAPEE